MYKMILFCHLVQLYLLKYCWLLESELCSNGALLGFRYRSVGGIILLKSVSDIL